MYLISLNLVSPTRFGSLPHHHQRLRISCYETEHVVVLSLHFFHPNLKHSIYVFYRFTIVLYGQ
jgi:hypothetical protein